MSQQINLANPQLLKKRYVFGLREMLVGTGLALAGALIWAGYLHYQASGLEAQAVQLETEQATAQAELDEMNARAQRVVSPQLLAKIKDTQLQVAQRETLLDALGGTIEHTATGFSPRLRALAFASTDGVWLNGFSLSASGVQLKGAAFNAGLLTSYIEQLGKQAPFAGLKFSGMTAVAAAGEGASAGQTLPPHLDFELSAGDTGSPDQEPTDAQ